VTTINYDKPVKDLIHQLDATGHVTHSSYHKTSVTFHHNAGRLSHEGVLSTWKTRPASAHFDVDANGDVAQYVRVEQYAWAVGNTEGNKSSISIEMANSTLAPRWEVSPTTWRSAARLAGWLFAKVIHQRPSNSNCFRHHHWASTSCAGPYIDLQWNAILAETQKWYDYFNSAHIPPPSTPTPTSTRKTNAQIADEVIAGKWGNNPERSQRLRAAGYDPNAIQAEVNRQLSATPAPASAHKTNSQIADEVIAGKWGNNPERSQRLRAAGYDPNAIQAEVNRKLS
jgi:N-acetyl-anhydromuramyl-L-alanine amidase AmpD